jgi:NDP-sugar pyrophosphorylase family protein
MDKIKVLLLAAGKSTRILPISKGMPKPLLDLDGQSVIKRNLAWLARSNISDVWVNLHYRPEEIKQHVGDGSQWGLNIRYVLEPEILGTAGAVKNLQSEWSETFLVVYGDNLLDFSLDLFLQFHRQHQCLASIALFDRNQHMHTGIAGGQVILDFPYIQEFIEGSSVLVSPYVNAGVYFLEPAILKSMPENIFFDFGKDLFPDFVRDNKMAGHVINGYCLGIDTPESYQSALTTIKRMK